MAENIKRKAGRKAGSITRKNQFDEIVYSHIPEELTYIQHKNLMVLCVESGKMAYQSMQDALNRLQLKGLITKERLEAIKGKRVAGTYYRRKKESLEFWERIPTEDLQEIFKERAGFTPTKQALESLLLDYHIASSQIWHELIEYAINPDKDKAKMRLNLVFTDIISPELRKIADKFCTGLSH